VVEATPTFPDSRGYTVELRWNDGWDAGLPRPAFLLHRIDLGGGTHLLPRSPTQHDWVPGESYSSSSDGICVEFLDIDSVARSGRVRMRRTIGQSADALVAGGWGRVALQLGPASRFTISARPGNGSKSVVRRPSSLSPTTPCTVWPAIIRKSGSTVAAGRDGSR
jgi:hypothetical protein